MLRQFRVGFIEPNLIFAMLIHTSLEVVTLEDSGDTAKIAESIDMGSGPALLIHGKESFHIGIAAVR